MNIQLPDLQKKQPDTIQEFILTNKKRLLPDQIRLLKLLDKKIYGVKLHEHLVYKEPQHADKDKPFTNKAVFKYSHIGVTGSVEIRFS